ncbi:MAG: hypothetical protein WBD50_08075 [Candidatus Rhabdochlamydia sp.]
MSTLITPDSSPGYFAPPLQESSSWGGKVVIKVHEVTSCVISSISSVAQSILSGCIYVGTLGHYTLDDLKDYFSKENASLEGNNDTLAVSSTEDDIKEKNIVEPDSTLEKKDEELSQSRLNRHPSKVSVSSQLYRSIRAGGVANSPYSTAFQGMGETMKLSTRAHPSENPKSSPS